MNNNEQLIDTTLTMYHACIVIFSDDKPTIFTRDRQVSIDAMNQGKKVGYLSSVDTPTIEEVDGKPVIMTTVWGIENHRDVTLIPRDSVPAKVLKPIKEAKIEPEGDVSGLSDEYADLHVKSDEEQESQDFFFKKLEYTLTDSGNLERFLGLYGKQVKYCDSFGWLYWNGKMWVKDDSQVFKYANKTAQSIYKEAALYESLGGNHTQDIIKIGTWAKNSLSKYHISSMVDMAQHYVKTNPDEFDENPMLLNVGNGIIDLKTGKLLEHDPKYMFTKIVDVDYEHDDESPTDKYSFRGGLKKHTITCS